MVSSTRASSLADRADHVEVNAPRPVYPAETARAALVKDLGGADPVYRPRPEPPWLSEALRSRSSGTTVSPWYIERRRQARPRRRYPRCVRAYVLMATGHAAMLLSERPQPAGPHEAAAPCRRSVRPPRPARRAGETGRHTALCGVRTRVLGPLVVAGLQRGPVLHANPIRRSDSSQECLIAV